jgi:broad-specificity NMP kinase
MKIVVFITGTNAVGKTTLAWSLIDRFGGIYEERDCVTYCKDKRYGLAGLYKDKRYGGVDRITNDKGSSCTSRLAEVVSEGLKTADVMFCEGSFMNTFGLNLTNALFLGDAALVVSLYAPPAVIYQRLKNRSNGMNGTGKRNWPSIFRRQTQALVAAQKYEQIGCKVLQFDTSVFSTEQIRDEIINALRWLGNNIDID